MLKFTPVDLSKQKFQGALQSFFGTSSRLRSADANLKCVFPVWFFFSAGNLEAGFSR